jgi:hypothetical protein
VVRIAAASKLVRVVVRQVRQGVRALVVTFEGRGSVIVGEDYDFIDAEYGEGSGYSSESQSQYFTSFGRV